MPSITLGQIVDAIETQLSTATGLVRSQSYSELTEGQNVLPTLQVYPQSGNTDASTANDRTTFKAAVRQYTYTIHADLYARQRSHIGEDMNKLVTMIDAIENRLTAEKDGDFGLAGMKSFKWSWERVNFVYGDPAINYYGARFTIQVWVY